MSPKVSFIISFLFLAINLYSFSRTGSKLSLIFAGIMGYSTFHAWRRL